MHDFGNIKGDAGATYKTFLPAEAGEGTARLEIHVQWSRDGKTYFQAMTVTTPDVRIKDGKLDWMAVLNHECVKDGE